MNGSETGQQLTHLRGDTFVLPGDWSRVRPWLGVISTSAGVVVVDSGNGPAHADTLLEALAPLGGPPVTHVLLTHHHWDHVFGNCAFARAEIIAHEQTQYHLQVMAEEPWSERYVRQKVAGWPDPEKWVRIMTEAVYDWTTFRAVPATRTFADGLRLHVGESIFHVKHVGGQHEPDQVIVHVQPANVIYLGDAVYGRGPRRDWDKPELAAALQGFLDMGADLYVPGHSEPEDREAFARRIEQLRHGAKE